jgi:hypothetical protein
MLSEAWPIRSKNGLLDSSRSRYSGGRPARKRKEMHVLRYGLSLNRSQTFGTAVAGLKVCDRCRLGTDQHCGAPDDNDAAVRGRIANPGCHQVSDQNGR